MRVTACVAKDTVCTCRVKCKTERAKEFVIGEDLGKDMRCLSN